MCRDCYELDLPDPTWTEQLTEDKEFFLVAGLALAIPAGIFVASCILEYFLTKRK